MSAQLWGVVGILFGGLVWFIWILHGDVKRAREIGKREGYREGYKDGRDGSPPEDW